MENTQQEQGAQDVARAEVGSNSPTILHQAPVDMAEGTPMETSPLLKMVVSEDVQAETVTETTAADASAAVGGYTPAEMDPIPSSAQEETRLSGVDSSSGVSGAVSAMEQPATKDRSSVPGAKDTPSSTENFRMQNIVSGEKDMNAVCSTDSISSSPSAIADAQVKGGDGGSKRPKSPQVSSSAESAALSASNPEGVDGVDVSDSLQNLSVASTDQAQGEGEGATTPKSKKKRRRKKKKSEGETPEAAAPGSDASAPSDSGASPSVGSAGSKKGSPPEARPQSAKGSKKGQQAKGERSQTKNKEEIDGSGREQSDSSLQSRQIKQQQQQQRGQRNHQFEGMNRRGPQQQQQQQQQHHQNQQQQGGEERRQGQQTQASDKKKKKHHSNRKHFEPHWTEEQLSEGLKRGTIFEGRIRINPKNYEDAYIPLPDGSADIYIPGMTARNRALNGDIVAVQIENRDNWRVYSNELDQYEQQNTPAPEPELKDQNTVSEEDAASGPVQMDADSRKTNEDEEDGPDVVVEEVEETEFDNSGNPISTKVTKPSPADLLAAAQNRNTTPDKGAKPKQGQSEKGKDSPRNRNRYMSVKDIMDKGSPVARQLFAQREAGADSGQTCEVNMDKFMQKTGKVVAIIEQKHSRACSGSLRPMQDKNPNCAIFSPTDSRVPRIIIPASDLPPGFQERPGDFTNVLFIARILEWHETMKMPKGTLARSLGEAGEIEPQTEALLIENDVDSSEFSEKVTACLPKELPWTIPASEFDYRRDFRKECVFTIDPSTARDLDDALSCRSLGDGLYEVGVHIADVSYFVKEGTALDEVASSRSTSVYLVQKVIPMLPRLLCEELCSLNPDEDRLTFSVVWKMTEDGEILDEWFGRSVIRSCVKLSYDHAQGFIDDPERTWTPDELPPISEGFCVEDIKSRVLIMDKMAKAMRKARFDSGALRLDQLKIQFTLDKESGMPNGYFVYQQRDSNKLVEEFMLLANMAVAHKIKTSFQDKALLRRHPPPQTRMIDELKETCASLGYPMEVDTAKDIQLSLQRYTGQDDLSKARMQVLVVLCSKPMQNAKYFCCGVLADEALYHHYALNVPLYTHFTSPIRRYPDILVHRTLAAALGYCDVTERSSQELHVIAEYCNDKKTNAKRASELSNEIYFSVFVKEAGPLEEKGMVMNVLDKSFDVYVLTLGVVKRVYCEKLPLERFSHHKEGKRPELTLVWNPDDGCPDTVTQKISIFSSVNCVLKSEAEPLKWSAIIRRPQPGDPTYIQ